MVKWRQRRKLISPSFHYELFEKYLPAFNHQSLELIGKLKSLAEKDYIDITPLLQLCSLAIISETLMGLSIGTEEKQYSEYIKAENDLLDIYKQRALHPWLQSDILFGLTDMGKRFIRSIAICHNFRDKVIRERKGTLQSDVDLVKANDGSEAEIYEKRHKSFLDMLLDLNMNGQLSDEGIKEEVDTFIAAGYGTTANALTYALYCIGLYPEVQRKISEELDDIFEGDVERPVTYEDIRKMKYLERVIKESQRLFPTVGYFSRKMGEDIQIRDWEIPKNTTVRVSLLALHRNAEVFSNPEIFDPERFNPENARGRHRYAFIPFSIGPRNCIGQKFAMLEVKTVVCNILRHFNICSLVPRDEFHVKQELLLKPAQEVKMKFFSKH